MIKDSLLYFFSKFFPAIISIITMFIFLKMMDSQAYGKYSIIIVTIGLVNIITSQWLRSSMIRYFFGIPQILNAIISIQLIILIVLSLLNIIILNIIGIQIIIIFWTTLLLGNLIIFDFLNNYFRTIIKPKVVLFGNLIRNTLFLLILLIILVCKEKIEIIDALSSFTIGLILSNTYLLYFYNYKFKFNINSNHFKKISIYGVPLTISFALGVLLQNIDKYMITYILDIKSNGDYSLIYDFVHNSLYMVIGSLGMASLPRIIKQSNESINIKEFDKYIEILYLISVPLTFTFISISSNLSIIINNYGYNTSKNIIILIIIATFIHGTNTYVYGQAVQLMQNTKIIYIPSIIAILVNIGLNIIFLPHIGVLGAALSTFIAFIVSNICIYKLTLKNTGINYFPKILYLNIFIGLLSLLLVSTINFSNVYVSIVFKCFISMLFQIFMIAIIYFFRKRMK
ncbi:oligosaccharide flippase family protein [Mammaliicoccus sp. H-M33]|uniref:oligosaccharide flippase family protein n=1 Tax=Mammaliicoccus sp. H-M33 TaxID=2898692 RepID=UPI001EFB8AB2|nr:oligosaccharide flippase family protein [Mammaliicoccus sp. H-M33]